MMPCSPAITFCSIVGQARRQTAGRMGPSTIERSNVFRVDAGPAIRDRNPKRSLLRTSVDGYAAANENSVRAEPHSGPRRAERAKERLANQPRAFTSTVTTEGYQRRSPWLVARFRKTW